MKAFKITDPKDENRNRGFVVAKDYMHAMHVLNDYCTEMEDDDLKFTELNEMTREEYNALQVADDTQEPDENGDYPLIEGDYDNDVENATEAYVIEFDH